MNPSDLTVPELPILELITNASLLVQLVMLILVLASLTSWLLMLRKRRVLSRSRKAADVFEERFWSGADLNKLYHGISRTDRARDGIEKIFEAGYEEYMRLRQERRVSTENIIPGVQRAMRIALTRETDRLEQHLNFLATVGSTSPYIGLFGTVWGIMSSFRALGTAHQATIAMVAPGISEALIATAMGLLAAIPAVIAYNRFSDQVERLETRYDNFREEFTAILERQIMSVSEA